MRNSRPVMLSMLRRHFRTLGQQRFECCAVTAELVASSALNAAPCFLSLALLSASNALNAAPLLRSSRKSGPAMLCFECCAVTAELSEVWASNALNAAPSLRKVFPFLGDRSAASPYLTAIPFLLELPMGNSRSVSFNLDGFQFFSELPF
jgi:hypothetical protein